MELLKRTKELHQRVSGLAASRGRYEEGKELEDFRTEKLLPRLERLIKVQATCAAFGQRTVVHPATLVPATLPTKVTRLRDRFAKSPTRTTLVASNGWPALQPAVEAGIADAEKALCDAWSAYYIEKVPQDTVASLQQDAAIGAHPENATVLQEYEKVRQQLAKACSALPRTPAQVDEFLALVSRAQALLDQLNREPPSPDLLPPPDVQRFLQALQRRSTVGLDLVTAEVLEWLAVAGRLGQFEVRRKAS